MNRLIEIVLAPGEADALDAQWSAAAAALRIAPIAITAVRVRKKSVDARQNPVVIRLAVEVWWDEEPPEEERPKPEYPSVAGRPAVVIVGAGPAGLFAALRLIERGLRPVIVERGKDVQARRYDLA